VVVYLTLDFDLLRYPDQRDMASFVLLSAMVLMAHLLFVVNGMLHCLAHLAEMAVDLAWIIVTKAIDESFLMQLLSIASALGAGYFGVLSVASSSSGNIQTHQKDDYNEKKEGHQIEPQIASFTKVSSRPNLPQQVKKSYVIVKGKGSSKILKQALGHHCFPRHNLETHY
jgi:hypothetical protein